MAKQSKSKAPSKTTSAQPDATSKETTESEEDWLPGVGPKPIRDGNDSGDTWIVSPQPRLRSERGKGR